MEETGQTKRANKPLKLESEYPNLDKNFEYINLPNKRKRITQNNL